MTGVGLEGADGTTRWVTSKAMIRPKYTMEVIIVTGKGVKAIGLRNHLILHIVAWLALLGILPV